MSSREGRGRPHRDYPSRSDENPHHGRGNHPPSRHLWVGNLSHSLTESDLARHFLQFGKLESVAFQPGRSYAFVNYKNDEDAFAAIKVLQGYSVEGNPLRIEFTKAENSSTAPRDTERRNEPNSFSRGSHYTPRARHSSPDPPFSNKSKMNDKDSEPSEELWIGFPAQLKVDEFILRKAFSPFGEIDKITAFPGRPYAFVRYTNVMAARRAKETLEGKLFGNPRVHICFAKNESGPSNRERGGSPKSPRGSYGRPGSSERFRSDKMLMSRDPSVRSPNFIQNFDHDVMGLARNTSFRNDSAPGPGPGRRYPRDVYEHANSPSRDISAHFREFSPHKFPRPAPLYDRPWDLPEDDSLMHGRKKLRTDPFPEDNDLPEYPFSDLEKVKHVAPHEIPRSGGVLGNNFDSRPFGYGPVPGQLAKTKEPFGERVGDHWNAPLDNFQVGSFPFPPSDGKRLTPDSRKLPSKEVWKWEGMIVKGGNSICRARCFPVGKPMDMALPEYLDCTAKTSLDMLAKHYFQSSTAWVVFFVPANDPDIAFYNDFMNFLSEKQRAAVVKLDEINTLFLVPPSEFSEKVLKVPGKLSISGVVLRLDSQGSNHDYSLPRNEYKETNRPPFHNDDAFYQKPVNIQSVNTQGHEYAPAQNWAPHDLHNSNSGIKNVRSPPFNPNTYSTQNNYIPEISGVGSGKFAIPEIPSIPSSMPVPGLPSEQLAQLASSLLGQQGQFGSLPTTGQQGNFSNLPTTGQQVQFGNLPTAGQQGQFGNLSNTGYRSGYAFETSQNYGFPNDHVPSESQFGQVQHPPQNSLVAPQPEVHGNQPLAEDVEADPQKRLQATLQLAATLLQQIQQSKGI